MLRAGEALPKPEKVKAKTISEVDVEIGLAKKEDLGKVGFFDPDKIKPERPKNFDELPEARQKEIDDRIKQRKEEFAEYQTDMKKLEDAGLIRIQPDGTVINTGLVKGGELPFTGDHDIFDIRARDGTKLTPDQYQAAVQALKEADAGVMHGAVTGWELDSPDTFNTPAGQKSYGKMVEAHSPGGKEPLVRFGDGEPKATWYEPAKPGAPAVPEARFVETSIGTLDMNQIRSLQPASPDALVPTPGGYPKGPPNSHVRLDEHVTLVFDGEGNLFMKVTRAQIEDVRTGRKANTPHQVADALGIDRRIEGPVPHEVDNLHGPDPSYTVKGVISDATARGDAPNWQGKYTPGKEIVIDGTPLRTYERAHTWGPGFGHESIYGIMLAPSEVNQAIQNRGIEKVIRDLHRYITPGGRVEVEVITRPHPHRPEYGDARFLASAEYTVKVVAPDGSSVEFKTTFEVDPPPGGKLGPWEVVPRVGDEENVARLLADVAGENQDLRADRLAAGVERENERGRRRR
jgi:hypothetical protein